MKIEELKHLYGKDVKIVLLTGEVFKGYFGVFTWAEDNIPERDSISINETGTNILIEIFIDEIKTIDEII